MMLQVAIGPVFFFITNIALQTGMLNGFLAVLAVTLVDYIYILLAIVGVGKYLENDRVKRTLGIVSSIFLLLFGLLMAWNVMKTTISNPIDVAKYSSYYSFTSAFILTLSSPLTIVFWTSIFASRSIEYSFSKNELFIFGLSAGFATFIFLGCSVFILSIFRSNVPLIVVQALNGLVAIILILYGIVRSIKLLKWRLTRRSS
jgi:Putative threonine efflux protein